MSYLASCEMCTGKGSGGYAPLETIASNYSSVSSSGYSSISYLGQNISYSPSLEYKIHASESAPTKEVNHNFFSTGYKKSRYDQGYLMQPKITRSYSGAANFVMQGIETRFVGDVDDISGYIDDAFIEVMGESLPDDIVIHVCSKERLREFNSGFGGFWSDGINGFAVNRKESGLKSEIFVAKGQLADVIATIGHEIGHCISAPLGSARDEEAKAFAFESAWISAINRKNIAGLRGCFNIMDPAKNNVHDAAFIFVDDMIGNGLNAIDICFKLMKGELKVGDI